MCWKLKGESYAARHQAKRELLGQEKLRGLSKRAFAPASVAGERARAGPFAPAELAAPLFAKLEGGAARLWGGREPSPAGAGWRSASERRWLLLARARASARASWP